MTEDKFNQWEDRKGSSWDIDIKNLFFGSTFNYLKIKKWTS